MKPERPASDADDLVSVIIPTHNRAGILAATVRSAMAQTYLRKEVIVVDDGSTDNTADIMLEFPDVTFRRKSQGGPASARNLGLREARGSVIALLDSDDRWDSEYLAHAVAELQATGAGFVCSSFRGRHSDGSSSYENYYMECRPHLRRYMTCDCPERLVLDPSQARQLFLAHSEAPSSATVLRREVVGPGWDDRLFGTEDHFLLLQAVIDHPCKAAFSLRPLWTKHTGTANIYDRGTDQGRCARMNILTRRIAVERWSKELTPDERTLLRRLNAVDYADWANYESSRGRKLPAIVRILQSALCDWSVVADRWRKR